MHEFKKCNYYITSEYKEEEGIYATIKHDIAEIGHTVKGELIQ